MISGILALGWGSLPYCFWMLVGAALFAFPLEKKPNWKTILIPGAVAYLLFGWLLPSNRISDQQWFGIIWYRQCQRHLREGAAERFA